MSANEQQSDVITTLELTTAFIVRFWSHIDKSGACWLWMLKAKRGSLDYGAIKLPNGKMESTHRVAFFLYNGFLPPLVRHTCDTPLCVRDIHLIDGTQMDNIHDALSRGRMRNGNIKLTPIEWDTIRVSTLPSGILAKQFCISQSRARRIQRENRDMIYRP